MRWQRHARFGFGVFALGFAIALWFLIGQRQGAPPAALVERLDPTAVSEVKGGDIVQLKGAKRDVRVEFATQVLYGDGSSKYTGFKAYIDDRGGRAFEISGSDAQVAPEQSAFDVRGDVTLRTSDGLTARTPQATFNEAEGLLRGDGPITFERQRVKGSGVGFRYERTIDRLELLDRAVITVAPTDTAGAMTVTAGAASHSRTERFMRFERGMHMEREGQIIDADSATVFLFKDRDEPETVELRGNATIGGAGSGSLRAMQARDINLRYAEDGRTLQHALLTGESDIQLARADGSPSHRLKAETIDATLAPDGAVTGLVGRDNVRVTVPPTATATAREITAQSLTGSGNQGRGLTRMVFDANVVYREDVRDADPRTVRARTLNASISDTGAIDDALFSGGFVFTDGRLTAESVEAAYHVAAGTLALRAPEKAQPPHIKNDRIDLRAVTIDATLEPMQLTAVGKVSAIFAAGRHDGERGTSVLSEDEPIVVICDTLSFDEQTGAGSYRGNARILQQTRGNEIRGDTITMNEKTGTLTASGTVVTSLPLARTSDGAKGNSIGRAEQFEFDDVKRQAVFTGKARLEGSQGNVRANRIQLALASEGNDLQQLTADGTVGVNVENREATGQHLEYHPADAKYVLTGTPVRLVQDCQESTGRTLTFYRGSEKFSVDGNEQTRVQMKGGKCPAPPSKQ
jgi:lipopolysaccharide export system protein LptA